MLQKLQKLLFEDDEDDYIDDEDDEVVGSPVKASNPVKLETKRPAPAVEKPAPVRMPEPPMMDDEDDEIPSFNPQPTKQKKVTRIDVTAEVPVTPTVKEERKPSKPLGITVDEEVVKPVAKPKVVKPTMPKKAKPVKPAKSSKPAGYEFKPVISPIFGVDEKDLNALKTTTKKVAAIVDEPEDEGNITPVISPIYGSTMKSESSYVAHEEAPKAHDEKPGRIVAEKNPQVEEAVPEFSLDDILKVRDEEFDNSDLGNTAPLFPDLNLPEDDEDDVTDLFKDSSKK